jgi:hypothetical protein
MVTAMTDGATHGYDTARQDAAESSSDEPFNDYWAAAARHRGWSASNAAWFPTMAAPTSVRRENSTVAPDVATAAADLVARSVATQEVPEHVTETSVLAKVATVLRAVGQSEVSS